MSLKDKLAATRQKIGDKRAGREDTYSFKVGKTYLRILAGVADPDAFYREFGLHWIKGPDGKVITTVGARDICFGEADPVREAIEALRSHYADAGDDAGVKRVKDMLAKTRFIVNAVVVRAPGEFDATKPTVVEFTENTWDAVLSQLEEYIEEGTNPFDPKTGIMLVVERIGTGLDTKYNVSIAPKTMPISDDIALQAVDLEAFVRSKFDERQQKAISALSQMAGRPLGATTMKMLTGAPAKSIAAADVTFESETDTSGEVTDAEFEEASPVDDDAFMASLEAAAPATPAVTKPAATTKAAPKAAPKTAPPVTDAEDIFAEIDKL